MKTTVGLWIDHRKAVIVVVSDKGEEIRRISSNIEKHIRPSAHTKASYGPQEIPADDSHQRDSTGHLNIYYDEVISSIRDAESILIFGPAEAKGELQKRIEREKLCGRIVGVETVDEMTDHQIAAKVRQYFLNLK
jgi:hypothetical protein